MVLQKPRGLRTSGSRGSQYNSAIFVSEPCMSAAGSVVSNAVEKMDFRIALDC